MAATLVEEGQVTGQDIPREIAVTVVAPTGKASFIYSYVQTRLVGQYNEK